MKVDRLFTATQLSASGLSAQRKRMNVIAENLANAETTRTAEGGPYRRKKVALEHDQKFAMELNAQTRTTSELRRTETGHLPGGESANIESRFGGVKANVTEAATPFREVYDPAHPDADENGMVTLPNVDIVEEMTELIAASRAYEANVTAFNATKGMMKKALEL